MGANKKTCSLVERDVRVELRPAHTVGLAALALDRDGQEELHHGVEGRLVSI